MAILRGESGEFQVPCRCLFGRSCLADIRLGSRRASSEHATLGWSGGRWTLRDLGSSNGTVVNGRPLLTRDRVAVAAGSQIRFGGDDETWILTEASAPEPCAVLLGPQRYLWGQRSLLILPSAEEPEASIFVEGERWRVDDGVEMRSPECGDLIELRSGFWRLLLPDGVGAPEMLTAGCEFDWLRAELRFRVGPQGVSLSIAQEAATVQLPSRACLYTLLALARLRASSREPDGEAGWVSASDLAEMRGCSLEKVNVDVHRLRKMFQEVGVQQAARIIERDDGKRLRIGAKHISES